MTGVAFETRELSPTTWSDFEALFSRYNGVQDSCWCMYYHRATPNRGLPDAARSRANRQDHRRLVKRGEAHGVLVYASGQAVGWCQFGRLRELPRIDAGTKYRALGAAKEPAPDWRVTCFFVDRPYRRTGVASLALRAALKSIAKRGGGVVEAYPSTHPRAVAIWFGTVSMFRSCGFAKVAPFGRSNVLMRRSIPAAGIERLRAPSSTFASVRPSGRRTSRSAVSRVPSESARSIRPASGGPTPPPER
jgi:GNAT superfamily N-acetyltransferase